MTTFFAKRRQLLAVPVIVLCTGFAIAAVAPVRSVIEAAILVTLGPEYTYRPSPGEAASIGQPLERDQAMHTEAQLIASADLHRAVLRMVGVDRLYPDITAPPGMLRRLGMRLHDALDTIQGWAGLAEDNPSAPPDPVESALKEFESRLSIDVPRIGGVITITFKHKNPVLGAEALNTLVALYGQRRSQLYRDDQSGIVASEVEVRQAALSDAETRLAQFRLLHQTSGFESQRDILLRRRGEMESDRNNAQSQVAQLSTRLDTVAAQLATVPQDAASGGDTDFDARLSPGRAALDQARAQYAAGLIQYPPGSRLLEPLRAQVAAREMSLAEMRKDRATSVIRTTQNPAWLSLQDDKLKTKTNLAVQTTRLAQDTAQLAVLVDAIRGLDGSEQQLRQLELQRQMSEDGLRAAARTLDAQHMSEELDAHRRPTVRVVQPAVAPAEPPKTRLLIVEAAGVLSLFGLFAASLLAHAFSGAYRSPEDLEQDFGLAVLAVIYDRPAGSGTRPPVRMLGAAPAAPV